MELSEIENGDGENQPLSFIKNFRKFVRNNPGFYFERSFHIHPTGGLNVYKSKKFKELFPNSVSRDEARFSKMNPLHAQYSDQDAKIFRSRASRNPNLKATENIFTTEKGYEAYHKTISNKDISSLYFDRRPRAVRNQEANNLL